MSAGEFCPNNMMDKSETKGAHLGTLQHFIPSFLAYQRRNTGKRLVAFKSDVAVAFRLTVPIHSGKLNKSLPPSIPLALTLTLALTGGQLYVELIGDPASAAAVLLVSATQ
jgi:hypothetical protein